MGQRITTTPNVSNWRTNNSDQNSQSLLFLPHIPRGELRVHDLYTVILRYEIKKIYNKSKMMYTAYALRRLFFQTPVTVKWG
jgi:hypothetical protein